MDGGVSRLCVDADCVFTLGAALRKSAVVAAPGESGFASVKIDATFASPEGKHVDVALVKGAVATCGVDGVVELWDAVTGASVQRLAGGAATHLASAHGKLWSGGKDGYVRLWGVSKEAYEVVASRGASTKAVACLAVHPSGKAVAVGDASGDLAVWDPSKPEAAAVKAHTAVDALAWLGCATLFSAGGRSEDASFEVKQWAVSGSPVLVRVVCATQGPCASLLAIDVDDGLDALFTASKEGGICVWDLTTRIYEGSFTDQSGCPLLNVSNVEDGRHHFTGMAAVLERPGRPFVYATDAHGALKRMGASEACKGGLPPRPLRRRCMKCLGTTTNTRLDDDLQEWTRACEACNGTGLFPLDNYADDAAPALAPVKTSKAGSSKAAEVPSWLKKWLPENRARTAPLVGAFNQKMHSKRLQTGALVVLRDSLPQDHPLRMHEPPAGRLERQGGAAPALSGSDVGELVSDDRTLVPYQVRGPTPNAKPSWFEAWQLAPCPADRAAAGRAALLLALADTAPPPPMMTPMGFDANRNFFEKPQGVLLPPAPPRQSDDYSAFDFRQLETPPMPELDADGDDAAAGGAAVAPPPPLDRAAQAAAQAAAASNVAASLAAVGSRKASKRLQNLGQGS
ncbi:quinon protein alcohol dehydrogenase-like superfamily [Pelagophyceae sp. CCMP2097]|nr:quinon protein alcohol dehydrogenase-like superfamily [Pelagophyceae sp. CCMP2097]